MKSESWRSGLTQPANLSPSTSQLPRLQELRRPCAGSGKRWDYLTRLHRQSSQEELSRRGWRENGLSRRGWSGKKESSVRSRRLCARRTDWCRHRFRRPREGPRWCACRQCAGSIACSNCHIWSFASLICHIDWPNLLRKWKFPGHPRGSASSSGRRAACATPSSSPRSLADLRACAKVSFAHERTIFRSARCPARTA